jgi:hypothetical protein
LCRGVTHFYGGPSCFKAATAELRGGFDGQECTLAVRVRDTPVGITNVRPNNYQRAQLVVWNEAEIGRIRNQVESSWRAA